MTSTYSTRQTRSSASVALMAALSALLVLLTVMVLLGWPLVWVVALVAVSTSALAVGGSTLLRWDSLIALLLLIIFFIPIGRYSFPSSLPFELEPYRVFVMGLVVLWLTSLLIDPRVRLRATGFEAPIITLLLIILSSEFVNFGSISDQGLFSEVAKQLTFFLSFIAVVYAVVSLTTTRVAIDRFLKVLAGGGALVAFLAIVEGRTGYNVFAHLQQVIPILEDRGLSRVEPGRGGLHRVYASSQHPIALGAALVMLVPVSIYLAKSSGRRVWWAAGALLIAGSLATISRTSVLMLFVELLVYVVLRPRDLKRLWMFVPIFIIALHVVLPGTLGTIKDTFLPKGGLITEQRQAQVGSGRVVTLGPSLGVWEAHPLFGVGYGTRIVEAGPKQNAHILDDQWLGTLLEVGLFGLLVWLWLLGAFVARMLRAARRSEDSDAWLFAGLAAAVGSFAVGMALYDAFSFIQVTFVMFILVAVGAASLRVTGVDTAAVAKGQVA
jgi:O-antigen ligase